MTKKKNHRTPKTRRQLLLEAVGSESERALGECQRIEDAGRTPKIFHSRANGWEVIDPGPDDSK
jgi:hypothetical protein